MKRRTLPSLNALRAFDAVARHNSFTDAAAELNVTQSAASRQVKALEDYLGLALFMRTTRRIALTEAGRYYASLIHTALDRLEAGTIELISNRTGGSVLAIGTLPTFGTRWLIPRLRSFQVGHPDILISIVSNDGPLDFTEQKIDVAVRYGSGDWPDAVAERLMPEELLLVCSPSIMVGTQPIDSMASLRHHALLRHTTRPDAWNHWFRTVGHAPGDLQWGPALEHFFMVIQAAMAGLGLALLPKVLIEQELLEGTLVAPLRVPVVSPGAYYIVTPQAKAELPRIRAFRRWILAEAGMTPN